MATTGAVPPPQRFEADLIVAPLVRLRLHAQETAVDVTYHIEDLNGTGGTHLPAYAGDIEEAKRVAFDAAKAHARYVLRRAGNNAAIPATITWHAV